MPTPTHAHSVGGVESGCHRVLHAAQLHTGTELSASQDERGDQVGAASRNASRALRARL